MLTSWLGDNNTSSLEHSIHMDKDYLTYFIAENTLSHGIGGMILIMLTCVYLLRFIKEKGDMRLDARHLEKQFTISNSD